MILTIAGVLDPTHIHPVSGMGQLHEPPGITIWPDPLIGTDLINHNDSGGNLSEQLLNGCAPAVHNTTNFTTKRIVPF